MTNRLESNTFVLQPFSWGGFVDRASDTNIYAGKPGPQKRSTFVPAALQKARRAQMLKVPELAAALDVTAQTVRNWERGLRNPPLESVYRLAEVLDVPATTLDPAAATGPSAPKPQTLSEARTQLGYSRPDMAAVLNTTEFFVKAVERGTHLPPDATAWAAAYELTQHDLAQLWVTSAAHHFTTPSAPSHDVEDSLTAPLSDTAPATAHPRSRGRS
jgi:DNA-binding transcriptional regulator YiaG